MTMMMRRDHDVDDHEGGCCQSAKVKEGGEGLIIAKLVFTFEIIPTQKNVAVPNVVWIKVEREIIRIVLKNDQGLHRP